MLEHFDNLMLKMAKTEKDVGTGKHIYTENVSINTNISHCFQEWQINTQNS